jgi:hypothetical protein
MVDFDREFFDKRFRPDRMIFRADELCGHHTTSSVVEKSATHSASTAAEKFPDFGVLGG